LAYAKGATLAAVEKEDNIPEVVDPSDVNTTLSLLRHDNAGGRVANFEINAVIRTASHVPVAANSRINHRRRNSSERTTSGAEETSLLKELEGC
jgi:hypothetical protein